MNDSSFDEEKEFFMKHPEATLISEDELSKMISLTNKSFIPDAHYFGTKIDQFGGTYYSDRHELDLVYSIKGSDIDLFTLTADKSSLWTGHLFANAILINIR